MYTRAITMGNRLTRFLSEHAQKRAKVSLRKDPLRCQLLETLLQVLEFPHRQFGCGYPSGYLGVEIAADHPAGGDREHDPESHAGNALEFEVEWNATIKGAVKPIRTWMSSPVSSFPELPEPGPMLRIGSKRFRQTGPRP